MKTESRRLAGKVRPSLVRAGEPDQGRLHGAGQADVDAPHARLEGEPVCRVSAAPDSTEEAGTQFNETHT